MLVCLGDLVCAFGDVATSRTWEALPTWDLCSPSLTRGAGGIPWVQVPAEMWGEHRSHGPGCDVGLHLLRTSCFPFVRALCSY